MSGLKIHPTMRLGIRHHDHEDIETIIRSQFTVNIDDDNIESVHFITTLLYDGGRLSE